MKKFLLIALALLSNFANGQTFTKYVDNTQSNGRGFAYTLTIRISLLRTAANSTINSAANGTEYSVELVKVDVDKNKGWYQNGKFYSCSQLEGICNTITFSSIHLQLTYNCQGKVLESNSATFYSIGDTQTMALQPKSVGGSSCNSPTASGIGWVSISDNDTASKISSILQKSNSGNSNTTLGSNTNPGQTKVNGVPANTSGNDPLAHFKTDGKPVSNPMVTKTSSGSGAVDSFTKGYQQGQQISEVATGIVDLFAPTPAQLQRRAAEAAEAERQKKVSDDIERENKEKRFGTLYYYPLIDRATNGDINARMILYLSSYDLWCTKFVPKREEWFNHAFKNKNLDAIMIMSDMEAKLGKERTPYLKEAARLGSLDAMVELGKWYDSKSFTYSGVKSVAGENPEKAIAAFTEAADKGSPNAAYYLGMIYKYGIIEDLSTGGIKNFRKKMHVSYAIAPDEQKAFEWFSKSLQPDYITSLYSKKEWYMKGSYFESKTYLELASMYRKGKVIAKDKDKAKSYEKLHEEYTSYENEKKRRGF
ncbi:tetratricopeptide repeat protein [Flavobacterium sangjuense]|uniref:Sel1 repeat family protein n=1 Tax=Flavobacterium sangjuense TaxID=2518177 RepID=A0A4P7PUI2_9FLAO|nr:tetratricopeptide repeat protein [Flavobacterium sangjuense]QBZ98335.1 hypothetical protein GS03_01840 [Flavobacterium sangjuense]